MSHDCNVMGELKKVVVVSSFLSHMTEVPNSALAAPRLDHHQVPSLRTELKPSSLT